MTDKIDSSGPAPGTPNDSRARTALRHGLRLALIVVAVWLIRTLIGWLGAQTAVPDALVTPSWPLLLTILAAYGILIAVPFVPGVEIGVVLLMMEGARVAPLVYLATLIGLSIAYLAGWFLPYATLHRLALDLRLRRLAGWIARIAPLSPPERLALLSDRLPRRLAPLARGQRYLVLGLLINLPGSSLIGGGGGLALAAGLTRLYRPAATLLTFAIAVAPVPVVVWLTGAPKFLVAL